MYNFVIIFNKKRSTVNCLKINFFFLFFSNIFYSMFIYHVIIASAFVLQDSLQNTPLNLTLHGKNGFAEIFENLTKYRFENNFVWTIKILCRTFKLVARMLKLFTASIYST